MRKCMLTALILIAVTILLSGCSTENNIDSSNTDESASDPVTVLPTAPTRQDDAASANGAADPNTNNNDSVNDPQRDSTDANQVNQVSDADFFFEANGVLIRFGVAASSVLSALGEADDYFEAASCAFEGLDKTYFYHGFELYTYEIDGVDYVLSILLPDDNLETPEGLYIGADAALLAQLYGGDVPEDGLHVYLSGSTELRIQILNNEVASIVYMYITDE